MEASDASHHAAGSCSAQPARGVDSNNDVVAAAATSPLGATRIALTPLVPTSRPRNNGSPTSTHSEQELHRQLVESLIRESLVPQRRQVTLFVANRLSILQVADSRAGRRAASSQLVE